jgi:hypothetical protein
VGVDGERATAEVNDRSGALVHTWSLKGERTVPVPSGGFAIVTS